jgi:hypothetical protein
MKAKIIFLAILLMLCIASAAWAQQGGIFGSIFYKGCSPDARDLVCIRPVSQTDCIWTGNVFIQEGPRYSTFPPDLIPFGTYYVYVMLHRGSDCDQPVVQYFVHDSPNSRCDLQVLGPAGDPDGPDPGP